ncbi:MAG: ABC-three component system protein [Methanosarcinaceae archaeon]
MNIPEKTLARKIFKLKIHEANGQTFEDIFTSIMNYAEPTFQPIKPWGNIGDRNNDGYIEEKGIYFQVFAPEDIRKSYLDVINKLEKDLGGLLERWSPVNEFYFVVNDKYHGVNADCEMKIRNLKKIYNLQQTAFKTPKDLENLLFTLSDDQIQSIINFLPDPISIKKLDYSVLNEIIEYIMKLPLSAVIDSEIVAPDWDEKIEFNQLTTRPAKYLNNGYFQVGAVDSYLKNNGVFFAEALKDKLRQIYLLERETKTGDELFWGIVEKACPKPQNHYTSTVITIMSKYFETCDIFEEPSERKKQ